MTVYMLKVKVTFSLSITDLAVLSHVLVNMDLFTVDRKLTISTYWGN